MSLKVIGAGFGRTGTASLKAALEMLGFAPCHHMTEVFRHREQVPFWERAAAGETMDWEEVFAPYLASCDWPSCFFYEELAARYPDAKVILTLRDPQAWYKSIAATILPAMRHVQSAIPFAPLLVGQRTFGNDFSQAHMIEVFERHNAQVRQVIPAARLLVFDPGEGWAPLCRFLDRPVPPADFPLTNTTAEFQARQSGGR